MTKRTYSNLSELTDLVSSFEKATISRDDWRHAEHMLVALFYIDAHGEESALNRMRSGILNLLTAGFQVNLEKEMPYHETMTVFWVKTVADFNTDRCHVPLTNRASELVKLYDKDHPLKFYSRERLFSAEARERYVEPDLRQFEQTANT